MKAKSVFRPVCLKQYIYIGMSFDTKQDSRCTKRKYKYFIHKNIKGILTRVQVRCSITNGDLILQRRSVPVDTSL